jgi:hypothetical protein
MDLDGRPRYDRPMRAFVCEIDHDGLRRLLPLDVAVSNPAGHRITKVRNLIIEQSTAIEAHLPELRWSLQML